MCCARASKSRPNDSVTLQPKRVANLSGDDPAVSKGIKGKGFSGLDTANENIPRADLPGKPSNFEKAFVNNNVHTSKSVKNPHLQLTSQRTAAQPDVTDTSLSSKSYRSIVAAAPIHRIGSQRDVRKPCPWLVEESGRFGENRFGNERDQSVGHGLNSALVGDRSTTTLVISGGRSSAMNIPVDILLSKYKPCRCLEWQGRSNVGSTRAVVYHGVAESVASVSDSRFGAITISNVPLLHRVSQGEEAAVQECIARFGGLVWSLARRIGLPESEAEDVVHEIFTELWKNGYKYDASIASETAFVATIARRRLIDRRRRLGRQPLRVTLPDDAGEPLRTVRDGASISEEATRAAGAFIQLSTEQQRVLRLSVYEGLSHELISRATGMPLGTVKTHARRGLIRLRELLGVGPSSGVAGNDAAIGSSATATLEAPPRTISDRAMDRNGSDEQMDSGQTRDAKDKADPTSGRSFRSGSGESVS